MCQERYSSCPTVIDSHNFIVLRIVQKHNRKEGKLVGCICWRQSEVAVDVLFVASVCNKLGYALERQMICWLALAASFKKIVHMNYEEESKNRITDLKDLGFVQTSPKKRGVQMFWDDCIAMRLNLLDVDQKSPAFRFLCSF